MPFSAIAVICWIKGRSVAICEWQIMQVLTLGIVARGPCSTDIWQSVQVAPFDKWIWCEKSNGCATSVGREPMNSRSAWPNDAVAGVTTGSGPHRDRGTEESFHRGWPGLTSVHAAVTIKSTAAASSRAAL